MRKIDRLLKTRAEIWYPEDILVIRQNLSLCDNLTDSEVQNLYHYYSEEMWCASWLIIPNNEEAQVWQLKDFESWLLQQE